MGGNEELNQMCSTSPTSQTDPGCAALVQGWAGSGREDPGAPTLPLGVPGAASCSAQEQQQSTQMAVVQHSLSSAVRARWRARATSPCRALGAAGVSLSAEPPSVLGSAALWGCGWAELTPESVLQQLKELESICCGRRCWPPSACLS